LGDGSKIEEEANINSSVQWSKEASATMEQMQAVIEGHEFTFGRIQEMRKEILSEKMALQEENQVCLVKGLFVFFSPLWKSNSFTAVSGCY
jgi:hypothetical protein